MYTAKKSSTHQLNKAIATEGCPVSYTLTKIGGRWKPLIIFQLNNGPMRYNELRKAIPNITEKMLIQNLRELEADNLIMREVKPVVPPHVIYSLTGPGQALKPMFDSMAHWGNIYSKGGLQTLTTQ
jgi:DNA-binding HxlR family transcriptional regulator